MEILQNILVTNLIVGLTLYMLIQIRAKEDGQIRNPEPFDMWVTALLLLDSVIAVIVSLILVWL